MEKYGLTLIGVVFGALAGYFYYRQVGCVDGSCPITSSPWLSSGWGAAFGGLLASMFKRKPKEGERFYRAGQEFGPKGCGAGTGLPCGRVVIGYAGEAGPEMPVTRLQRSGYEASVGSGTIIENSKS